MTFKKFSLYLIQDKEHLILGRSFIERVYFFQSRLPRNIIVFMINPLAFFSSEQRMNVERHLSSVNFKKSNLHIFHMGVF